MRASTADFQATTALIAAVALFAGAFLIFNTLSMTVSERIREVGLLRAAGARRGQVMSFMLTQALVLGVAGSLLGPAPRGAAWPPRMVAFVRTIGSVTLDRAGAAARCRRLIALLVGVGRDARGGARARPPGQPHPARRGTQGTARPARGSKRPPALARGRLPRRGGRRGRPAAALGAAGPASSRPSRSTACCSSATLLIPFILPAIARIAGTPFAVLLRFEERLARSSVVRDRSRTTLTLGGLTIGLAMIVALGGVGQHARAAAAGWIADVVPGDLVATSIRPIAADEGVAEIAGRRVPGLARVSPIATFDVALEGTRTDAAAVVGSDMAADGRLRFVAGDRDAALAALDAGGAAILPAAPRRAVRRRGRPVADSCRRSTADGSN